jgi:hypothetical protein
MENRRPYPRVHAEYTKENIVWLERVGIRDALRDETKSTIVAVKVEHGEKNAAWFLDSRESQEGPFSMELVERQVLLAEEVGDLSLTGIIAFRRTVP